MTSFCSVSPRSLPPTPLPACHSVCSALRRAILRADLCSLLCRNWGLQGGPIEFGANNYPLRGGKYGNFDIISEHFFCLIGC